MSDHISIPVPGPKIMLIGGTGTGKTHSLHTLIEAGLKVAAIFTEPGMEVIADVSCEEGMHYHYIPPSSPSWDSMLQSARKINTLSFKGLADLSDIDKRQYTEFIDLIESCGDFHCDRCGQSFGPVDDLGLDWAFVMDSLSGLSVMGMNLVVGSKPVKSQADWGVAMDNVERFITKMTTAIKCTAVLMAHAEREVDEITGGSAIMASTLGRKLAPKIPRFFSDVILTRREGDKFTWDTAAPNVDLKARNIRIAASIPPTFVPLIEGWRERMAKGDAK